MEADPRECDEALRQLTLRSMFWRPEYVASSAWAEHVPFAFWLIDAHRPRELVELGTHTGVSYFSFCQAVERLGLDTRCYAVDTWKGDEHAGTYGEEVFEQVQQHNQSNYSHFSRLVRSTFDEALEHFSDGTIDLLHIDGLHTLDAVVHDFESWVPKLSTRAVVVFHDTNVRERGFGVYKLFERLRTSYPSFEFSHGNGLGVLGVGADQTDLLAGLFAAERNPHARQALHAAFGRLGATIADACERQVHEEKVATLQGQLAAALAQIKEFESSESELLSSGQIINESRDEIAQLRHRNEALTADKAALELNIADRFQELAKLTRKLIERDDELERLASQVDGYAGPQAAKRPPMLRHLTELVHKLVSRRRRELRGVARQALAEGWFDVDWYLRRNPDVAARGVDPLEHYFELGGREGRDPSPRFCTSAYLEANPDVAESGTNALVHYLRFGRVEGRTISRAC